MKSIYSWLAYLPAALLLLGCDSICENEVQASVVSPSGNLKAVVFHRSCGAATGFNTQVSVIAASSSLQDDGGNVLIVDGNAPLKLTWLSESRLSIKGVLSAGVFTKERSVPDVEIVYE
ncbi:MAG: hypothetical protein V4582_16440 [Pseudomonadota bacterium]